MIGTWQLGVVLLFVGIGARFSSLVHLGCEDSDRDALSSGCYFLGIPHLFSVAPKSQTVDSILETYYAIHVNRVNPWTEGSSLISPLTFYLISPPAFSDEGSDPRSDMELVRRYVFRITLLIELGMLLVFAASIILNRRSSMTRNDHAFWAFFFVAVCPFFWLGSASGAAAQSLHHLILVLGWAALVSQPTGSGSEMICALMGIVCAAFSVISNPAMIAAGVALTFGCGVRIFRISCRSCGIRSVGVGMVVTATLAVAAIMLVLVMNSAAATHLLRYSNTAHDENAAREARESLIRQTVSDYVTLSTTNDPSSTLETAIAFLYQIKQSLRGVERMLRAEFSTVASHVLLNRNTIASHHRPSLGLIGFFLELLFPRYIEPMQWFIVCMPLTYAFAMMYRWRQLHDSMSLVAYLSSNTVLRHVQFSYALLLLVGVFHSQAVTIPAITWPIAMLCTLPSVVARIRYGIFIGGALYVTLLLPHCYHFAWVRLRSFQPNMLFYGVWTLHVMLALFIIQTVTRFGIMERVRARHPEGTIPRSNAARLTSTDPFLVLLEDVEE